MRILQHCKVGVGKAFEAKIEFFSSDILYFAPIIVSDLGVSFLLPNSFYIVYELIQSKTFSVDNFSSCRDIFSRKLSLLC